ncbi:MAG: ATP-grasp domain-containing protein [Pirellulales bacterium]|nr:ATP-grasp domain-containing protein [Pirellulales bacterium]
MAVPDNVMILGAGVYQLPLIRKVKEMGFRAVVVSINGDYPGIPEADRFLPIDTTDVEAVLAAARDHRIRAVVTTGTDVCIPALGAVNDALGLCGVSRRAAVICSNKAKMKDALAKNHLNTAEYAHFETCENGLQFAARIGFPVIVKAIDSSGSRGIMKANTSSEFAVAWKAAAASTRSKTILVERFLSGTEFGVQAFVRGGDVVGLFPHRDTVTQPPISTPIGHAMPLSLGDEATRDVETLVAGALSAIGIRDAVCNIDLMMVQGRPWLLEVGARMGATCLAENVGTYAGFDTYEYVVALALGEKPSLPSPSAMPRQPNASLLLRGDTDGIVRDVNVPDAVRQHPDLVSLRIDVVPGNRVRRFQVGPDRIGHIVVKGRDSRESESTCESMAKQISFEIE